MSWPGNGRTPTGDQIPAHWVTTREYAEIHGVCRTSIGKAVRRGRLPGLKDERGNLRVDPAAPYPMADRQAAAKRPRRPKPRESVSMYQRSESALAPELREQADRAMEYHVRWPSAWRLGVSEPSWRRHMGWLGGSGS